MAIQQTETIQRLWDRFVNEQLAAIPPEERRLYEQQLEDRFAELVERGSDAPTGRRRLSRPARLWRQGSGGLRGDGISVRQAGFRRQRRSEPVACRGRALFHLSIRALESVPDGRCIATAVPAR